MQGLGLYFQESSKDFNGAGTALAELFVPGGREVLNSSEGASMALKVNISSSQVGRISCVR
jgi:hypothetical protein